LPTQLPVNQIIHGSVLEELQKLPEKSINCCITSPPYFNARQYQTNPIVWPGGWYGELGSEPTIYLYIDHLMLIFEQIKRVLTDDGSFWLNIGDGFNTGKKGNTNGQNRTGRVKQKEGINAQKINKLPQQDIMSASYLMIPERIALRMIDVGWGIRDKVVWWKPDGMPNSQHDRLTPDYEMLYRFVKQRYAYFDTQYEPYQSDPKVIKQYMEQAYTGQSTKGYESVGAQNPSNSKRRIIENMKKKIVRFGGNKANGYGSGIYSGKEWDPNIFGRHKRSVWKINTAKLKIKHFAAFPEALVEIPIKATCPQYVCRVCGWRSRTSYKETRLNTRPGENVGTGKSGKDEDPNKSFHNSDISRYRQAILRSPNMDTETCSCVEGAARIQPGICLDPFAGSGTTCVVAKKLGRDFIGLELNESYIKVAMDRINTIGS
jgi:DNA modification methylase